VRHSFPLWVSVRAGQAPAEGRSAELLQWWPLFKAEMGTYAVELNKTHLQHVQPPPELQACRDTVAKEIVQCWRVLESAQDDVAAGAAVQQLLDAKRRWARIVAALRMHGE
jgi:hypothetical protein